MSIAKDWLPETRDKFRCEQEIEGRCCRDRATWRLLDYLKYPETVPAWLCDEHFNELKEKEPCE